MQCMRCCSCDAARTGAPEGAAGAPPHTARTGRSPDASWAHAPPVAAGRVVSSMTRPRRERRSGSMRRPLKQPARWSPINYRAARLPRTPPGWQQQPIAAKSDQSAESGSRAARGCGAGLRRRRNHRSSPASKGGKVGGAAAGKGGARLPRRTPPRVPWARAGNGHGEPPECVRTAGAPKENPQRKMKALARPPPRAAATRCCCAAALAAAAAAAAAAG